MSAISSAAFEKIASPRRRMNGRILFGRECVQFAAEVLQPAVDLPCATSFGALEKGVFDEMRQSVLVGVLVAASSIDDQSAMRYRVFDLPMDAADAVRECVSVKFGHFLHSFSRIRRYLPV